MSVTMPVSPYKLIFFDNDGTLNNYRSTWEYFHKHLGTWEPVGRQILEDHLSDRSPYDEFSRESVKLWTGIPREKFLERLRTLEIRSGVIAVLNLLKSAGIKLAVLSSGFSLWKEIWKEKEGIEFDHYHANDLIFDNNGICSGRIEMHVTDNVPGKEKGTWVDRIGEIEGIPKEERVFVGDGWGDVSGFKRCAFGIAIDPNMPEVNREARYVLEGDEFIKLLDILQ